MQKKADRNKICQIQEGREITIKDWLAVTLFMDLNIIEGDLGILQKATSWIL